MAKVLQASNVGTQFSSVTKDFAAQDELWVTAHAFFCQSALDVWIADPDCATCSGTFLATVHDDGGGAFSTRQGIGIDGCGPGPEWFAFGYGFTPSGDGPVPVAGVWVKLELHWSRNDVAEFFLNDVLVSSGASSDESISRIVAGQDFACQVDPAAIAFIDDVKVGTTRGASDIFSDDFESGTLAAWDSSTGEVSVVDEPSCEGGTTLTVAKAGAGSGTVTSSPSGINCGGDCSEAYASGTTVTLTAAPAPGSIFAGWSGGGCGGTGTCSVVVDSDITVTATFTLVTDDANTSCDTAVALTGTAGAREADNTGANGWAAPDPLFSDPLWGLGYGGGGPLWWKYTNPYSSAVVLQLFLAEGTTDSIERALIGIFRGSCGALYAGEIADTQCDGQSFFGYTLDVTLPTDGQHVVDAIVMPGETVYVEVDGYSGDVTQPPTLGEPNRGRFVLAWEVHSISMADLIEESHDYAIDVCLDLYGGHTKIEDNSYVPATVSDFTVQTIKADDLVEFGDSTWYTSIDRTHTESLSPVAKVERWNGASATTYALPTKGKWFHRDNSDGAGVGHDTEVLLNTDGETLWAVAFEDGGPTGDGWPNPAYGAGSEPAKWRPAHPVVFRYDPGTDAFVYVGAMRPRTFNSGGGHAAIFEGHLGGLDATAHPSMPGRIYVIWSEKGAGQTLFVDDPPPGLWIEHMAIGCFGADAPFAEFDVGLSSTAGSDAAIPGTFTQGSPPFAVRRGAARLVNDQGVCQVFRIAPQRVLPGHTDPYMTGYVRCEQIEDSGSLTLMDTINYVKPPGSTYPDILGPLGYAYDLSIEPVCHSESPPVPTQADSWVFVAEGSDFPGDHPDYAFLIANGISGVLWLDTDDASGAGLAGTRAAGLLAGIWVVAGNDEDPLVFADRASDSVDVFKPDLCVLDCEVVAKGFPPDDPGWLWSETMMARYRTVQQQQNTAVTMLPLQDDFNYEAYWSRGVGLWPQSYGTSIPADDLDPIVVRDRVLANGVPPGFVKVVLPYDPWAADVVELRDNGIFTFAVFTAEGMQAAGGGPPPAEPPPSPETRTLRTVIVGWVAGTESSSGAHIGGLAYNVTPLLDSPWHWYNENVNHDGSDVNVGQLLAVESSGVGAGAAARTLYTDRFGQTWGFQYRGGQEAVYFDRNCGNGWGGLHMPRIDGEIFPAPASYNSGRQVVWHEADGDYLRVVMRDGFTSGLQLGHVKILRKWSGCGEPGGIFVPPTADTTPFLIAEFRAEDSSATPAAVSAVGRHLSGIAFRASDRAADPVGLGATASVIEVNFRAEG